jgi:hypothetical protein
MIFEHAIDALEDLLREGDLVDNGHAIQAAIAGYNINPGHAPG